MNLYAITAASSCSWGDIPPEDVKLILAQSDEAALRSADFLAGCHVEAGGTGDPSVVFLVARDLRCVGTGHAERHERRQDGPQ